MARQAFSYRPPSYRQVPDHIFKDEVDKGISKIYDAHATLNSTAIKAPTDGSGFSVQSGHETVTGSKLGVATGLATVNQVVVSIDNGATATNFTATGTITPTNHATIDIYVWQPTAVGDTTPIAATSAVVVRWWVTGEAQ